MISKPQKLDALTSLRFFAAAMIVVHHGSAVFGSMGLSETLPLDQGVSFFFVLSGFILAYNYPVLAGEADILAFFKARIARIWPAHLAAIVLVALLSRTLNIDIKSLDTALFAAVANFFLFQSIIPVRQVFFAFNPVAWSISTEMFFYFAFPLLIAKSFFDWRFKLGLLLAIVFLHIWFVAAWDIPYDSMTQKAASVEGLLYINPTVRVFEFFSGILAYWSFMRLRSSVNYSERVFTALEAFSVLLTLVVMYYSIRLPALFPAQSHHFTQILSFYIYKSGSFWAFALMILVFAFAKGGLTKVLSSKLMVLLGEISFALYLVHRTVLEWYQMNTVYFEQLPQWFIVTGYWLVILLISYLLHKIVENPCRRLLIAFPKWRFSDVVKTLFAGQQKVYVLSMIVVITAMTNLHRLITLEPCYPVECQMLIQQHPLSPPAVFGDDLKLTALHLSAPEDKNTEYRQLNLLFETRQALTSGYRAAIHLMTENGSTVTPIILHLHKARQLTAGGLWSEHINIPATWLKQGTGLGIVIHFKSDQLNASYAKTDNNGKRALFDFAAIANSQ